ncbi:MAG: stage II sporulation protein M, partial [Actinomycetota bacterium]|nr:stage II sporulation protein M [Actinomycetota bacterium]
VELRRGDMLVFATDGVDRAFEEMLDTSGTAHDVAARMLANHWRGHDDALVVAARWIGPPQ